MFNLEKAIKERYLDPTNGGKNRFIGIKVEIPVVNLDKKAVDKEVMIKMLLHLEKKLGLISLKEDMNGDTIALISREKDKIELCYSCEKVRINLACEDDLMKLYDNFAYYFDTIQAFLVKHNHLLTGFGINPYRQYNENKALDFPKYKLLEHYLASAKEYNNLARFKLNPFCENTDFLAYTAKTTIFIDISASEATKALNTLNYLEPIKAILFSNSASREDAFSTFNVSKIMLERSVAGLDKHNIGAFDVPILDDRELVKYIKTLCLYHVARNGKYYYFKGKNLIEYFDSVAGNNISTTISNTPIRAIHINDDNKIDEAFISPTPFDLNYLKVHKELFLSPKGAICISLDTQSIDRVFAPAAFYLGIIELLNDTFNAIMNTTSIYNIGYTIKELTSFFNNPDMSVRAVIGEIRTAVSEFIKLLFGITTKSLKDRHKGEEVFLESLYGAEKSVYFDPPSLAHYLINTETMKDEAIKEQEKKKLENLILSCSRLNDRI